MSVAGVEGEEREDLDKAETRQLRQRSVRLLGSLLRPLRGKVAWTFVIVVISTAAQCWPVRIRSLTAPGNTFAATV